MSLADESPADATDAVKRPFRVAVLVSGSGTNLQALIDAQKTDALGGALITCVVSNVPGAGALERATNSGIEALTIDHRTFADRAAFDRALSKTLAERDVDLVVLAGFMRLLSKVFLDPWKDRVVNVHPSILPAFPGAHALRDALAYGVRVTGCTVHFVDEGTDTGPIIAQSIVPIRDGDDEAALRARIQLAEHALLPKVVGLIAQGRVKVSRTDGARPRVHLLSDEAAKGASGVEAL